MPEVLTGDLIIGPVRRLYVQEDNPRPGIFVGRVAPHEVIPVGGVAVRPGALKPRVFFGTMVHHQIGHHAKATRMSRIQERLEILQRTEIGMDAAIIGHVIPVILQGRGVHRLHPDAIDAQRLDMIQFGDGSPKIAVAVAIGIATRANV